MIGRVKAHTWHNAIEYVKNSLFHDRTKAFNIDCEKTLPIIGDSNEEKETTLGFKLYLK